MVEYNEYQIFNKNIKKSQGQEDHSIIVPFSQELDLKRGEL